MKLITLTTMVLVLAGFAFAEDCNHEDCDGVTPCTDCTCEETVEGCTGDCCTCDAEECDDDCTCECDDCEHTAEVAVEDSHCGAGGRHEGCPSLNQGE